MEIGSEKRGKKAIIVKSIQCPRYKKLQIAEQEVAGVFHCSAFLSGKEK